jgi:hypothetical protein
MSVNRTNNFWILLTAEGDGQWGDPSKRRWNERALN